MGDYGSTEVQTLYCEHNHSTDFTTFYNSDGSIADMQFQDWSINGKDKIDAFNKLIFPFKGDWGTSELQDGVEFYREIGE